MKDDARRARFDAPLGAWFDTRGWTPASFQREAWRRDSLPMVFARHPRQRRALFLDTFVRRTHANFMLALLGVLIVRRHPLLGFAAMLPYLRNRRPPAVALRSVPQILVHLPTRIAVDATEVVAVGRAAVRHRVPVI